ncbi:hypothetical protein FRB90_003956, partial [Tulasnella sp. 427]
MASSTITEEARRRKTCLDKWNDALNKLVEDSNAYMTSTAQLVRACPLNDTAPLQKLGVVDDGTVASVTDVFDEVKARLFEVGLVEEQVRLSKSSLVRRRNRMADVSSVSRLPDEVLSLVFEYIARTKETTVSGNVTGLRRLAILRPEIIFTWVSQQWRDIALNLPRLWRDINFYRESPPFARTQRYLVRSQEIPLNVTFMPGYMPHNNPFLNADVYLITAVGTVLPAFKRWESITIIAENVKQLRRCFYAMNHDHIGTKATHIKSIRLVLNTAPGNSVKVLFDEPLTRNWRSNVDGLTSLSLTGVAVPWDWPEWSSNLRHLKLVFTEGSSEALTVPDAETVWPTKVQFRGILRACPDLETLELVEMRFRDVGHFPGDPPPLGPVTTLPEEFEQYGVIMHKLRKLAIRIRHTRTVQLLLDMMIATNVEEFHCDTRQGVGSFELGIISTFFDRLHQVSNPPLRHLTLSYSFNNQAPRTGPTLLQLLALVPGLQELVIYEGETIDDLLRTLTPSGPSGTQPHPFPKLEVLKLLKIDDTVDPERVVEMVQSRASLSTALGPDQFARLRILHIRRPSTDSSNSNRTLVDFNAMTPLTHAGDILRGLKSTGTTEDKMQRLQQLTSLVDE